MQYVHRALRSESGIVYYEVGPDETCWVTSDEFRQNSEDAKSRVQSVGISMLHARDWNALRAEASDTPVDVEASVIIATRPGWARPDIYVFPDGKVIRGKGIDAEVFVGFPTNDIYRPKGSLASWKAGFDQLIPGSKLITGLLAYGFAPLLLDVAPSYILNPQLELVGPPECGKTIVAKAIMSIYGGNPRSELGIGRSWDMTEAALESVRSVHTDGMLFLDENSTIKDPEVVARLVFGASSSSSRARYGDTHAPEPVHLALLSTGNIALSQRGIAAPDKRRALLTRLISLQFRGPLIVQTPSGFDGTREVVEALNDHCDKNYGMAARRFVHKVVARRQADEVAFRAEVLALIKRFKDKMPERPHDSDRILDTCALTYAAGKLAKQWDILPSESADVYASVRLLYRKASASLVPPAEAEARRKLRAVIRANKGEIIDIDVGDYIDGRLAPLGPLGARVVGEGDVVYYFKVDALKEVLGDNAAVTLKALKSAGDLISEKGRLSKKAPRPFDGKIRVYEVRM